MNEQLVQETICLPLGMSNTAIRLSEEQKKRLSPGHDAQGAVVPGWRFDVLAPAGGFRSNADDVLKFLAANLAGADSKISKALHESHKTRFVSWDGAIGLGWH